jgi:hypothetical protein
VISGLREEIGMAQKLFAKPALFMPLNVSASLNPQINAAHFTY